MSTQILHISNFSNWKLTTILLLSFNIVYGQSAYNAVILDKFSSEPISNVNILIVNSTEGYFSDKKGKFSLPYEIAAGADLIFSHLNYEASSKFIPLDYSGIDTIYLSPISHQLENVTITSKNNHLKKIRLLQFRKDLFDFIFGKKNMHKEVDFLNPDDIIFLIENKMLIAQSSKLLNFRNNYLGYDFRCFMEEYSRDNLSLTFAGKGSFKDILASKRKKKKYQKRREELWKVSQQNFLRSVISNNIDPKAYLCSALVPTQILSGYQEVTDFSEFVYPTKIQNVYAIISPAPISIRTNEQISHIIPKEGIILVNKKGIILNKKEVDLRGYWEGLSLTKFLPTDYKPVKNEALEIDSKTKKSIGELRLWARELMNYSNQNGPIDEIIIETDRFYYQSNETVLINAHIFDHRSRRSIDSCLVKIQLVNQDNEVIASKTKLAQNGTCNTSFELSDTLLPAQYGIRAYTGLLRNFSENIYGKTTIAVNMISRPYYSGHQDSVSITFVPEGGKLLSDCDNRMVAFIDDKNGNPIEFNGWLVDNSTGEEIIMNTILPGISTFNLSPSKSSHYEIKQIPENHIASNINLIKPTKGTNLHVFCRNKDNFKISFSSNDDGAKGQIKILDKGRVVHELAVTSMKNAFSISKDFLPNEILNIQLLDEDEHLLSERLIDNRIEATSLLEFKKQYQFFYPNQTYEIDLLQNLNTEFSIDSLEWNVRIVHKEYGQNIEGLDGHPNVSPVSDDTNNLSSTNRIYIRNLELIGNTISSDYKSAYELEINDFSHVDDFSLSIAGVLKNPEPPFNPEVGKVSITSMSSIPYYNEVSTNEEGEFRFEKLPYEPNLNYVIQAGKGVDNEEDLLKGNRYLQIEVKEDSIQPHCNTTFQFKKNLIPNDSLVADQKLRASLSKNVVLDQVVIKDRANRAVRSGLVKDIERMDWIPKESRGQSLVKMLYPSKIIRRSIQNPSQMEIQINSRKDGFVFRPLKIFINGIEEFGTAGFEGLVADRIKYLTLNQTVLSIITTPGSRSRTDVRAEGLGIATYAIPETTDNTDLASINDSTPRQFPKSDNRKTLYWNPQLLLTKSSDNKVIFRSSSLLGEYEIIASTIHPQLGYVTYSSTFEVLEERN